MEILIEPLPEDQKKQKCTDPANLSFGMLKLEMAGPDDRKGGTMPG